MKTLLLISLFIAQTAFANNDTFHVTLKLNPNSDPQCTGHYFEGVFSISQFDSLHANLVSQDGKSQRIFNGDVQNGWVAANYEMDMNKNIYTTEILQLSGNIYTASLKSTRSDRTVVSETTCDGSVVWLP